MKLSRIYIKGFKCIRDEISIDLAPLTIFVGPNGSGKSTILEALDTIFHCIHEKERIDDYAKKQYDDIIDIFFGRKEPDEFKLGFSITLNRDEKEKLKELLNKIIELMDICRIRYNNQSKEYKFFNSMKNIFLKMKKSIDNIRNNHIEYKYIRKKGGIYEHELCIANTCIKWNSNGEVLSLHDISNSDLRVLSKNYNLEILLPSISINYKGINIDLEKVIKFIRDMFYTYSLEGTFYKKIFYISSYRGNFNKEYRFKDEKIDVGRHGENTIDIINNLLTDKKKYQELCALSERFGIKFPFIRFKDKNNILEGLYEDIYYKDVYLKFPHLGFGSKQILPIITQIVNVKNSIILIEEPEISLHAEYQRELPKLFAYGIKEKGHQFLITTHSIYFVLSIGEVVEKEHEINGKRIKLDRNDIRIYEVTRDEKGVKLRRYELDERGYIKEGIDSFLKVEKELYKNILGI